MWIVALVVAALVVVATYVVMTYNALVSLRLGVDNSWAQVDVALRLRHDLVPNLSAAVSGYAEHERGTFEQVTAARALAVSTPPEPSTEFGAAEAKLALGIGQLFAVAEAYPDLKASELFQRLQQQLADIENQIQVTRRVYNDVVERYMNKVQTVPSTFVASLFKFEPREFFKAPVEAQFVPILPAPAGE